MNAPAAVARASQRVPIIRLYGSLVVPLQDMLPDHELEALRDEVTRRIVTDGATGVVLDVSAVAAMDSYVTRVVRDLAMTARLMGARTVLSGVAAPVAITMIEMGLDLPGVSTALDLERALELLFEQRASAARVPDEGPGGVEAEQDDE